MSERFSDALDRLMYLYNTCCSKEVEQVLSPRIVVKNDSYALDPPSGPDLLSFLAVRTFISVPVRLYAPKDLSGSEISISAGVAVKDGVLDADFRCVNTANLLTNSFAYRMLVAYALGHALGFAMSFCVPKKVDSERGGTYVCASCPTGQMCYVAAAYWFLLGYMNGVNEGVSRYGEVQPAKIVKGHSLGFLGGLYAVINELMGYEVSEEKREGLAVWLEQKLREAEELASMR